MTLCRAFQDPLQQQWFAKGDYDLRPINNVYCVRRHLVASLYAGCEPTCGQIVITVCSAQRAHACAIFWQAALCLSR